MDEELSEPKETENWEYLENGSLYTIRHIGKMKYGYGNWKKSVTYSCSKGEVYTRDMETFLEKFKIAK